MTPYTIPLLMAVVALCGVVLGVGLGVYMTRRSEAPAATADDLLSIRSLEVNVFVDDDQLRLRTFVHPGQISGASVQHWLDQRGLVMQPKACERWSRRSVAK